MGSRRLRSATLLSSDRVNDSTAATRGCVPKYGLRFTSRLPSTACTSPPFRHLPDQLPQNLFAASGRIDHTSSLRVSPARRTLAEHDGSPSSPKQHDA